MIEEIADEKDNQEPEGLDVQPDDPDPMDPETEKASRNGWRPKDEWNGDPDDWVSAKNFNQTTNLMNALKHTKQRVDEMERDFDDRLKANQKLHDIQKKALISQLESKRDDAIDDANKADALKYQSQIDDLNEPAEEVPATRSRDDQLLDNFNRDNPWIKERTPKAAFAKDSFNYHFAQTGNAQEAIDRMMDEVGKEYPARNPNRDTHTTTETRRSVPGKRQEKKITWGDLNADELKWYQVGADNGAWKNKDEYLKAVADARKAEAS